MRRDAAGRDEQKAYVRESDNLRSHFMNIILVLFIVRDATRGVCDCVYEKAHRVSTASGSERALLWVTLATARGTDQYTLLISDPSADESISARP